MCVGVGGAGGIWEISMPSAQFCCEHKTINLLKLKAKYQLGTTLEVVHAYLLILDTVMRINFLFSILKMYQAF